MKNLSYLLIALFCLFSINSFSQSLTGTIKGQISDSITGLPIENFTVFIPYTTYGTTSNSNGEFILDGLPYGQYDVMFRHVAYMAKSKPLTIKGDKAINLNLSVSRNIYDIEAVIKESRYADWNESMILFRKHFLGDSHGNSCKIKNPRDIIFYYEGDILMAHAKKPLVISNRYLGYEITYFLDYYKLLNTHIPDKDEEREKEREGLNSFERLKAGWTEPLNTASNRYYQSFSGSAFYKDLAIDHPIRGINWLLNRKAEFSGNLRHFLICLYQDKLSDSRYEIRKGWNKLDDIQNAGSIYKPDSISVWDHKLDQPANLYYLPNEKFEFSNGQIRAGGSEGEKILYQKGSLLVFYDTENTSDLRDDRLSEISIKGGQLGFDSEGNYDVPIGSRLWVYHDSEAKIKVLLPNDYLPKPAKKDR